MSNPYEAPSTAIEERPTARVALPWGGRVALFLIGLVAALGSGALVVLGLWMALHREPRGLVLALVFATCAWMGIRAVHAAVRRYSTRPAAPQPSSVAPELMAELQTGKRPLEWSLSLEEVLAFADHNPTSGLTLVLAAEKALDHGKLALAGDLLDRALREAADWHDEIQLMAAAHAALVDADVERARMLLATARAAQPPIDRDYTELAHAAVLLAEGTRDEARTALRNWERVLERSPTPAWAMHGNHWTYDTVRARLAE